MSEVMSVVPSDHPEMKAWNRYKSGERFANSLRWMMVAYTPSEPMRQQYSEGSMWAAFDEGWRAAEKYMRSDTAEIAPESVQPRSLWWHISRWWHHVRIDYSNWRNHHA